MKIKKITLYKVDVPMVTSFAVSSWKLESKATVIVQVEMADGLIGYGEAAAMPYPFYKPDTTDICMLVLRDYIAPLVLNKEFTTVQAVMDELKIIKKHNFAKTGLETALLMVQSLQEERSLSALLGGTRAKIGAGESIGIKDSIEATLEEIELRISQGYQRMKLKIKPGWDVKLVKAVRARFGDVPLMVDANSVFTLDQIEIFKELDQYNLTMIEQPLGDDDIVDHSVLQKQIKTPICLDESILSVEDARKALFLGACKIINIKPGRVGGILESKKIHDLCQAQHVGVWCGGMLETGIGRAFNIAVASLPNFIDPADMSPNSFYYKDDLVKDSFTVDLEGNIQVPTAPGLGFEVDEMKLKKYTVEKLILD